MAVARADQDEVHFVVRGINLKNTGTTVIVPSTRDSRRFVLRRIDLITGAGSGVTVGPTVRCNSVGNSGSAGDVVASTAINNLNQHDINALAASAAKSWSLAVGFGYINLEITTGATATTLLGDVHVMGYFT